MAEKELKRITATVVFPVCVTLEIDGDRWEHDEDYQTEIRERVSTVAVMRAKEIGIENIADVITEADGIDVD